MGDLAVLLRLEVGVEFQLQCCDRLFKLLYRSGGFLQRGTFGNNSSK